ncbi:IPT/TIG domain-containing protein [Sinomicrobium sp. M5D2P9]
MKTRIIKYVPGFMAMASGFIMAVSCKPEFEPDIVTYPEIMLSDFNPKTGRPTTPITISGTNFGDAPEAANITFNGTETGEIISYSDTEIVVAVPEEVESGPITVQVWTHKKVTSDDFEYIPGAELFSVSPESADPGEILSLTGANFGNDPDIISVTFGDIPAEVVSVTDSEIRVVVPEGTSGTIRIYVDSQTIEGPFFLIGEVQLTGSIFGHESSWGDNPDTYVSAAFDGNTETFVDAASAEGYAGIDLGEGKQAFVTRVRYFPRASHPSRMEGGEIRVSNDPDYINNYTSLYTISEVPSATEYSEIALDSGGESYRYIYYYSGNGYGNVAELEFYGVPDN